MKSIRDLVVEIAEEEANKEFTPERIDAAKSEYIKELEQKLAEAELQLSREADLSKVEFDKDLSEQLLACEQKLAIAEGEWKTYATMSDSLSKKLAVAELKIKELEELCKK